MAEDNGYYDPYPRRVLERPLALTGFMGSGVRQTAHALASHEGLSLHDLDRLVEHAAGMSRARLQLEQGETMRRHYEREQLVKVVRQRPAGVIALGDGALIDPQARTLVVAECQLIWLHRPLELALRALNRQRDASPAECPEFVLAAPRSVADLEPLYQQRLPGYRAAALTVTAAGDHPSAVATRVRQALGWS